MPASERWERGVSPLQPENDLKLEEVSSRNDVVEVDKALSYHEALRRAAEERRRLDQVILRSGQLEVSTGSLGQEIAKLRLNAAIEEVRRRHDTHILREENGFWMPLSMALGRMCSQWDRMFVIMAKLWIQSRASAMVVGLGNVLGVKYSSKAERYDRRLRIASRAIAAFDVVQLWVKVQRSRLFEQVMLEKESVG
ncbi:hypothetical protein C8F01DRAFT_1266680 [Mycena amicta]|nr:hypothetical protein C8F01DRAFT_1266680 [Mycena amicta]